MRFFIQTLFQEQVKLCVFLNANAIMEHITLGDNSRIDLYCLNKYSATDLAFPLPSPISKPCVNYSTVVVIPNNCHSYFGHYITDALCLMTYIPNWVLSQEPVICFGHPKGDAWQDLAKAALPVNYRHLQFHNLKNGVHADKMYAIIQSSIIHTCSVHDIAIKFKEYFNITNVIPDNIGYYNKKKGYGRHFYNMGDLIRVLERKYGKFIKLEINVPDHLQFYKTISTLKILVCPCGSASFNSMFMAKGTGLLTIAGQLIDQPGSKIVLELSLWSVTVIHRKIPHKKAGVLDVSRCSAAFDYLLEAINIGKWPPFPKYYSFTFEEETLRKELSKSQYVWQCL